VALLESLVPVELNSNSRVTMLEPLVPVELDSNSRQHRQHRQQVGARGLCSIR